MQIGKICTEFGFSLHSQIEFKNNNMAFILVFIPVFIAMAYALVHEYQRKFLVGSITLTVVTLMTIGRFVILGIMFDKGYNEVASWMRWAEAAFSMYIIPVMYMYLCDQCGTKWNNREAIAMSILPLLAALHSPVISLGTVDPMQRLDIVSNALNVFNNGQRLFYVPLRPAIVVINCLIVSGCMVRLWYRLKKYGLKFTKQMWAYYIWMALLLGGTAVSFIMSMQSSADNNIQWEFFIYFSVVLTLGYIFIPYSFRVKPIVTEDGKHVGLDSFIVQDERLVHQLHQLLEEDKIYLKPGIFIEDVATMMATNRTYVTRLMRQEFNQTFNEYINNARIMYSKKLLLTTDMTVEDIALASGFPNGSAYCRVFKRFTGISPVAWKGGQEETGRIASEEDEIDEE